MFQRLVDERLEAAAQGRVQGLFVLAQVDDRRVRGEHEVAVAGEQVLLGGDGGGVQFEQAAAGPHPFRQGIDLPEAMVEVGLLLPRGETPQRNRTQVATAPAGEFVSSVGGLLHAEFAAGDGLAVVEHEKRVVLG
jgi:hypothetical protein